MINLEGTEYTTKESVLRKEDLTMKSKFRSILSFMLAMIMMVSLEGLTVDFSDFADAGFMVTI